jgi:hypothetical protein
MQWYDYTKQSPKLILVCNGTEQITFEQSILITLLHLCGWDIAIVIPTAYNVLGDYLKHDFIQEHTLGEPVFNKTITHIAPYTEPPEKVGFFKKLFG